MNKPILTVRRLALLATPLAVVVVLFAAKPWWPAALQSAWSDHFSLTGDKMIVRGHDDHDYGDEQSAETDCEADHDHGSDDELAPSDHSGHDHEAADSDVHEEDVHEEDVHDHSAHADDGHDHDESTALRLSKQAEANIGLDLRRVELEPFARTISLPAAVVQRPGRSQVQVTATFTGLVTRIHRIEGEAVAPGESLFDLRLTHEELVEAQANLLQTSEQLDVVRREVARVAKVAANGAIAGKALLERQYEQQKLEATLHSQRERLLLHRLSEEQIDGILDQRKLLQALTVDVPTPSETDNPEPFFQVHELKVEEGQHVNAGDPLCVLADHAELYVEGRAFEQDIPSLRAAAKNGWKVAAVLDRGNGQKETIGQLEILYLADEVEVESRAFYFYVNLPNRIASDGTTASGQRFVDWRFKPGQRLRLHVPFEPAADRIVLPAAAVVSDGVEAYVFQYTVDHFDRRPVHVEYRDQDKVVIANDGALKLGVQVAVSGAYQVHLATKNKTGGKIDPHAGHAH